jgi:LPXTG-motif cell wall-anchored protein
VWVTAESNTFREDDYFSYDETHVVAPGAIRVLRVRGPASDQSLDVNVSNLDEPQTPTENLNLAYADLQITCPRTAARPAVPVAVGGATLPQTGGFNIALPLLGAALLAGGAGMVAVSGRRPGAN